MKFAKYWQKQRVSVDRKVFGNDHIMVWGASNESEQAAQQSAASRVFKMSAFIQGDFSKGDDYDYWIDFVKEEIVDEVKSQAGETIAVLSRNNYGATILNTSHLVFGDIDVYPPSFTDRLMRVFGRKIKDKSYYLSLIEKYQKAHPHLAFRVYETHSGVRFILTNKRYAPNDDVIKRLFEALHVDPLYSRLCQQQECYRARMTPKPWRLNISRPTSRFPREDKSEQQAFQTWLSRYQSASSGYSVVKYMASFGSTRVDQETQIILDLHDRNAHQEAGNLA
ncbi:hypothetical protein [Vibrio intestinalis]|uniref:hypothetical protein n=1 Tax=Vibrio intestinalis TaxID=2933291 RepID=UPI0021A2E393|nr:hypothetical protein [Vibrio intestinalis]